MLVRDAIRPDAWLGAPSGKSHLWLSFPLSPNSATTANGPAATSSIRAGSGWARCARSTSTARPGARNGCWSTSRATSPASSRWPTRRSSRPRSAWRIPPRPIRNAPGIGAEPRIDQSDERRLYDHYGVGYSDRRVAQRAAGRRARGRRARGRRARAEDEAAPERRASVAPAPPEPPARGGDRAGPTRPEPPRGQLDSADDAEPSSLTRVEPPRRPPRPPSPPRPSRDAACR